MRIGMPWPMRLLIGAVTEKFPARRRGVLEHRIDTVVPKLPLSPAAKQITGVRTRCLEQTARLLRMPVDLPLANVVPPALIFAAATALACGVIWFGIGMMSWPPDIAAGLAVWIVLVRAAFAWERDRYRTRLMYQSPDTIRWAAGAIRTGLPVIEAFRAIAEDMESPTRDEFMRVQREIALGSTQADALLALYGRTGLSEYAVFAVSIGAQGRSGGDLTETMQNLTETVRQRLTVAAREKALAAQVKFSAVIMSILAVVVALGWSAIHRRSIHAPFHDANGTPALALAIITLLLGVAIMRQMIAAGTRD